MKPGTVQKFISSIHISLILDVSDQVFYLLLSVLSALRFSSQFFMFFIRIQRLSRPHKEVFGKPQLQFSTVLCGCLLMIFSFSCDPLVEKSFLIDKNGSAALFFFLNKLLIHF